MAPPRGSTPRPPPPQRLRVQHPVAPPQAARYNTSVQVQALMKKEEVLEYAQKAKDAGSTRFCMGAAWREVRDNKGALIGTLRDVLIVSDERANYPRVVALAVSAPSHNLPPRLLPWGGNEDFAGVKTL